MRVWRCFHLHVILKCIKNNVGSPLVDVFSNFPIKAHMTLITFRRLIEFRASLYLS